MTIAIAYAPIRMPAIQARLIQISLPTVSCANSPLMVFTMEVTGWFSANQATGPGIEVVGTNAELMNGDPRLDRYETMFKGGPVPK